MDPVTAAALIQGGSTILGGIMGNKAAKQDRAAAAQANRMRMMPYLDARNYVTDMYSRGQGALDSALDAGFYQGPTYAGLDPLQTQAIQNIAGVGSRGAADANQFMNTGRGFAQNYADLYNQASVNPLDNAINYASANTEPLLRSAMRDPFRQLTEQTLPGIDQGASMTNNTNSSRAGVAEAIAKRAFDDRSADVAANIQDRLIDRSMQSDQNRLANMTTANQNLAGVYNTGFTQAGAAADYMQGAGGMLRQDAQNVMDDNRARFEGNRDFDLNQIMAYNAGILGRTPTSTGNIQTNMANPMMGAMSGAMAGFGFGKQYGPQLANMFATQPTASGPSSYGNTMSPARQQTYFSGPQTNFGGNPYI